MPCAIRYAEVRAIIRPGTPSRVGGASRASTSATRGDPAQMAGGSSSQPSCRLPDGNLPTTSRSSGMIRFRAAGVAGLTTFTAWPRMLTPAPFSPGSRRPGSTACRGKGMRGQCDPGQDGAAQRLPPPRHLFGGKRFGGAAASPDTAAKDSGDRQPLAPQGGLLPQGRGGVGFQPERLVIAEMPVETVHLAQRDQVEQPQQGVGLHEMPRANQVLAAPAKARRCDGAAPPARCRAPECRARPPRNGPRPRAPAPRPPPPGSGSSAKNTRLRPSAAHRCRWCNATRARQGWYRRSAASGSNWIRQGCQAATRPRNHRCRIGTGRG